MEEGVATRGGSALHGETTRLNDWMRNTRRPVHAEHHDVCGVAGSDDGVDVDGGGGCGDDDASSVDAPRPTAPRHKCASSV